MINRRVLMSDPRHFSVEKAINPYYGDDSVDQALALAEHQSINRALFEAGIETILFPSPADSQDGVYTANWALVHGDVAIMSRLPEVRRAEEPYAEAVLKQLGYRAIHVPEGLRFSGQGDALICGEYLFCGEGYRSDKAAQAFAANTLGLTRIQLKTIPKLGADGEPFINPVSGWPDSHFYDIDLALAVIKEPIPGHKGLIAYCPEAFVDESRQFLAEFDGVEKIEISLDEAQHAFAANLVSSGEAVVMSAHAPLLKAELEARGLRVITPEISELAKGGGYIRCTTLTLV